jgi:hypothetical protein
MGVCTTIADCGGRAFKKALVRNLMTSEDSHFMDEIVYGHLQRGHHGGPEHKKSTASSADDDFTSCEVSLAEEGERDLEEEEYEYLDCP